MAAPSLPPLPCPPQAVADGLGVPGKGRQLVQAQQQQLRDAANSARGRGSLRVACFQWPSPLMACGAWVPELVQASGDGVCVLSRRAPAARRLCRCSPAQARLQARLPAEAWSRPRHCPPHLPQLAGSQDVCGSRDHAEVVGEEQLAAAQPDVVIWALCGLGLDKSCAAAAAAMRRLAGAWARLPAAQRGRVAVVDGEHVFSRPGPLLVPRMEALVEILHPEAQRHGHEGKLWRWLPAPA